MTDRSVFTSLTVAGASPFLAGALLPLAGVETLGSLGRVDQLTASYSMAILCFLTGIHWATQLYAHEHAPMNLFMVSNAVFLLVWITFVATSLQWALAAQLLAFALLLVIDFRLHQSGLISRHYLRMRFLATTLACFSLILILVTSAS